MGRLVRSKGALLLEAPIGGSWSSGGAGLIIWVFRPDPATPLYVPVARNPQRLTDLGLSFPRFSLAYLVLYIAPL